MAVLLSILVALVAIMWSLGKNNVKISLVLMSGVNGSLVVGLKELSISCCSCSGSLIVSVGSDGDLLWVRRIVFVHIALGSIGMYSISDVKLGGWLGFVVIRSLNLLSCEVCI